MVRKTDAGTKQLGFGYQIHHLLAGKLSEGT